MSSITALIVDDSLDIRVIVKEVLNDRGYDVVEAANGYEAIQRARQYRPDLILMDLSLPGLDGWEVARRVRSEPALEEIPIIAMTGYCMASVARLARTAGCQSVVFKPLRLDDLEREVDELPKTVGPFLS